MTQDQKNKEFYNMIRNGTMDEMYNVLRFQIGMINILKDKKVDVFSDIFQSKSYKEYVDHFNHQKEYSNDGGDRKILTSDEYQILCNWLETDPIEESSHQIEVPPPSPSLRGGGFLLH